MRIELLTQDISPKKAKEIRSEYYKRYKTKGKTLAQAKVNFKKTHKNLAFVIHTYEQKQKSKTDLSIEDTYRFIRSKYLSEENILKTKKSLGTGYTRRDAEKFITDSIKIQLGLDTSVRIDTAFKTLKKTATSNIPKMVDGVIVFKQKSARTGEAHIKLALEHLDANLKLQQEYIDMEYDRRFTKRGTKRVHMKGIPTSRLSKLIFIYRGLRTWIQMIETNGTLPPEQINRAKEVANSITRLRALDMLMWTEDIDIYANAFLAGLGSWNSDSWVEDTEIANPTLMGYLLRV